MGVIKNGVVNAAKALTSYILDRSISDYDSIDSAKTEETFNMKNASAIFGMPYQFMPHVDLRLLNSTLSSEDNNTLLNNDYLLGSIDEVGATFADKIYSKMPLLMITPGKASFMSNTSEGKTKRATALLSLLTNETDAFSAISNESSGRFYDFESDMSDYFEYVNSMCRVAAVYLGLGDVQMRVNENEVQRLDQFEWNKFNGYTASFNNGKGILDSITTAIDEEPDYITYYVEGLDSISDSFSNSTSQSSLASTVNGVSSTAREMSFLAGLGSSAIGKGDTYESLKEITDNLLQDLSNIGQNGGIINNIAKHATAIAQGGKMIFPEIWSDSSYGKSYSVTVKLVSPDHDKLSIYMNIIVPIIHTMALVLPRSIDGNPNSYREPFIVRAIYKGNFAIDTGIISDVSVKRGGSDTWTLDGIPCEAELSIGIKDLYQAISMSKSDGGILASSSILTNTNLMDFLGNMCGIDIFTPDANRNYEIYKLEYLNFGTTIKDAINLGVFGRIHEKLQTTILNQCRKFMF